MDDVGTLRQQVPQYSDRQSQGQQQGGGVVERQAEAKDIDDLSATSQLLVS